jgi:radical SAM protein with 4Fe4S-binding SPASM domain
VIKYTALPVINRLILRDVLPLAKPFTVLIEPTSLCNFRCIQCFQSIKTDSYFTQTQGNMPLVLFQRVIDQLDQWPGAKLKVLKLSLYGEPMVNPRFSEMVSIAKAANIAERVETTTNASLLTRTVAEKLVQHQLDYARVSIYGSDQAQHKAVTGSGLSLDAIHENLRVLQEVKKRAGSDRPFVSCKMMDSYGDDNGKFIQMFKDVADEVYLDKPHNWIKVDGVDFIQTYYKEDAQKAISDVAQHSTERVACPMAFTTMAVRSNGAVSPCCVDFIGGTNLGNVNQLSLQELWNSDGWFEFQKMQLQDRKHENTSCARCDVWRSDHYTRDNIDGFPVDRLRPWRPQATT